MDILIIGFALFAMFFGAGNLIFPPMLGYTYGDKWLISGIGFTIVGVGLTLVAVISMAKSKGNIFTFTSIAGEKLSKVIILIIALCIGPLSAIPRTAATSSEMIISSGFTVSPLIFSVIFFAMSLFLSLSKNSVVDFIGKFLTPLLLISLLAMIILGIIHPIGDIKDINISNSTIISDSMIEGYNTMDALAALAFTPIIVESVVKKGYKDKVLVKTIEASIVAVIGLTFVYISLAYLGASASSISTGLSRVELLNLIANKLLGDRGKFILIIAIVLACFTTAIGLISSISDIFVKYSNEKISYKLSAYIITITSLILSVLGVDSIVEISSPFLQFAYPIAILLVIFNLVGANKIRKEIIRNSFIVVSIVSFLDAFISLSKIIQNLLNVNIEILNGFSEIFEKVIKIISLNNTDFPWVFPLIITILISFLMVKIKNNKANIKK